MHTLQERLSCKPPWTEARPPAVTQPCPPPPPTSPCPGLLAVSTFSVSHLGQGRGTCSERRVCVDVAGSRVLAEILGRLYLLATLHTRVTGPEGKERLSAWCWGLGEGEVTWHVPPGSTKELLLGTRILRQPSPASGQRVWDETAPGLGMTSGLLRNSITLTTHLQSWVRDRQTRPLYGRGHLPRSAEPARGQLDGVKVAGFLPFVAFEGAGDRQGEPLPGSSVLVPLSQEFPAEMKVENLTTCRRGIQDANYESCTWN